MISALSGELAAVHEASVALRAGPMVFEVLVPAADVAELTEQLGTTITLHTLVYLEGDPNRGNLEPRMIGFIRRADREFFELFTTVKGIGPKTALRALTESIGTIASAIEGKDARFLKSLKGIGQRSAELIIAELGGKTGRFVSGPVPVAAARNMPRKNNAEADAVAALVALGERLADADALLEKAKAAVPEPATTDALVREMLRLRTKR